MRIKKLINDLILKSDDIRLRYMKYLNGLNLSSKTKTELEIDRNKDIQTIMDCISVLEKFYVDNYLP